MDTVSILVLIALCIAFAAGYLLRRQNNYELGEVDGIEKGRKIYTGQIVRIDQWADMLKEDVVVKIIELYERIPKDTVNDTKIAKIELLKIRRRSLKKDREDIVKELIKSGKGDLVKVLQLQINAGPVERYVYVTHWLKVEINKIFTFRPAQSSIGLASIYEGDLYLDSQEKTS